MSLPRHEVTLSRADLALIASGETVTSMSDKHLAVQFVRADLYDQTPGGNGVQLLPVTEALLHDLNEQGFTGWLPAHSPYIFGIYLNN